MCLWHFESITHSQAYSAWKWQLICLSLWFQKALLPLLCLWTNEQWRMSHTFLNIKNKHLYKTDLQVEILGKNVDALMFWIKFTKLWSWSPQELWQWNTRLMLTHLMPFGEGHSRRTEFCVIQVFGALCQLRAAVSRLIVWPQIPMHLSYFDSILLYTWDCRTKIHFKFSYRKNQ